MLLPRRTPGGSVVLHLCRTHRRLPDVNFLERQGGSRVTKQNTGGFASPVQSRFWDSLQRPAGTRMLQRRSWGMAVPPGGGSVVFNSMCPFLLPPCLCTGFYGTLTALSPRCPGPFFFYSQQRGHPRGRSQGSWRALPSRRKPRAVATPHRNYIKANL